MAPKIYATGNENVKGEFNLSYYIFEKDPSFLDWLAQLLVEVLIMKKGAKQAKFVIKEGYMKEDKWVEDEVYIKDLSKMIDLHEKYEHLGERVDVFYGKDRVYVTLRKSNAIRERFAKFVIKTKEWIEVKEVKDVKEIPAYVTKQVSEQKESIV